MFLRAGTFCLTVVLLTPGALADGQPYSVRAVDPKILGTILELNPSMRFAREAMETPVDANHVAIPFEELGPASNLEHAGRKYAFVILNTLTQRIVLTLEAGTLDLGLHPWPVEATSEWAIFAIQTEYLEERRVRYAFRLSPPAIIDSMSLPPRAAEGIP